MKVTYFLATKRHKIHKRNKRQTAFDTATKRAQFCLRLYFRQVTMNRKPAGLSGPSTLVSEPKEVKSLRSAFTSSVTAFLFGARQPVRRSSWFGLQSFRGPFLDRLHRSFSRFVVRRCRRYYELICPPRFIVRQAELGLSAFMSDFPPEAFSDRSVLWCDCHPLKTETNRTSRFSRLECPRMHRFVDSAVSVRTLPQRCARCCLLPDRTGSAHERGALFMFFGRELSGWPALPFARTLKTVSVCKPPLRCRPK